MKTDAELVALVAENVMGWTQEETAFFDDDTTLHWVDRVDHPQPTGFQSTVIVHKAVVDWDPLISDADACAVLDKMADQDRVMQINYRDGCWDVWFSSDENMAGDWRSVERIRTPPGEGEPGDRRRAIVLAALKAVGVDIDAS